MRQVPKYCIVGRGQVARHIRHYFRLLGISFCQWSRHEATPLTEAAAECDRILILISDDAIEAFIRDHDALRDKTLIHFSGTLQTDLAFGAHPLMTFGPALYDLTRYRSIPFILDQNAPDFSKLFPALPNPSARLNTADKSLYHSLCVIGGNFSVLLWQKVFSGMNQLNIPREFLFPYLEQTFVNLMESPSYLTGPLVRGDHQTIRKHIEALEGDAFQGVYQAFVAEFEEKNEKNR